MKKNRISPANEFDKQDFLNPAKKVLKEQKEQVSKLLKCKVTAQLSTTLG